MEPSADISWLEMEPVNGHRRRGWTVEERRVEGKPRNPFFTPPDFLFRRRAERWVRKHSCEHVTYDVVARVKTCGHSDGMVPVRYGPLE